MKTIDGTNVLACACENKNNKAKVKKKKKNKRSKERNGNKKKRNFTIQKKTKFILNAIFIYLFSPFTNIFLIKR